jgi:hypothetical protein
MALRIELALAGSLVRDSVPTARRSTSSSATDGIVLHYSKLLVLDAAGAAPARLEGFIGQGSGGIRIVVDDACGLPGRHRSAAGLATWTVRGQASREFRFARSPLRVTSWRQLLGHHRRRRGLFDGGDEGAVFVYRFRNRSERLTDVWR